MASGYPDHAAVQQAMMGATGVSAHHAQPPPGAVYVQQHTMSQPQMQRGGMVYYQQQCAPAPAGMQYVSSQGAGTHAAQGGVSRYTMPMYPHHPQSVYSYMPPAQQQQQAPYQPHTTAAPHQPVSSAAPSPGGAQMRAPYAQQHVQYYQSQPQPPPPPPQQQPHQHPQQPQAQQHPGLQPQPQPHAPQPQPQPQQPQQHVVPPPPQQRVPTMPHPPPPHSAPRPSPQDPSAVGAAHARMPGGAPHAPHARMPGGAPADGEPPRVEHHLTSSLTRETHDRITTQVHALLQSVAGNLVARHELLTTLVSATSAHDLATMQALIVKRTKKGAVLTATELRKGLIKIGDEWLKARPAADGAAADAARPKAGSKQGASPGAAKRARSRGGGSLDSLSSEEGDDGPEGGGEDEQDDEEDANDDCGPDGVPVRLTTAREVAPDVVDFVGQMMRAGGAASAATAAATAATAAAAGVASADDGGGAPPPALGALSSAGELSRGPSADGGGHRGGGGAPADERAGDAAARLQTPDVEQSPGLPQQPPRSPDAARRGGAAEGKQNPARSTADVTRERQLLALLEHLICQVHRQKRKLAELLGGVAEKQQRAREVRQKYKQVLHVRKFLQMAANGETIYPCRFGCRSLSTSEEARTRHERLHSNGTAVPAGVGVSGPSSAKRANPHQQMNGKRKRGAGSIKHEPAWGGDGGGGGTPDEESAPSSFHLPSASCEFEGMSGLMALNGGARALAMIASAEHERELLLSEREREAGASVGAVEA